MSPQNMPLWYKNYFEELTEYEHLGDKWWWHKNISYGSRPTVIRFSHEHTQQISLLTVQHDDHLLFIKWKWSITKVFNLLVFIHIEQSERKEVLVSAKEWKRWRSKWRRQESQIHAAWWKWTPILFDFFLFHFSQNVPIWYQSLHGLL